MIPLAFGCTLDMTPAPFSPCSPRSVLITSTGAPVRTHAKSDQIGTALTCCPVCAFLSDASMISVEMYKANTPSGHAARFVYNGDAITVRIVHGAGFVVSSFLTPHVHAPARWV